MPVPIPSNLTLYIEAHRKWVRVVQETKALMEKDKELQTKAAKGLRLKERRIPPEVLGGLYAKYCSLANRMYQSYLDSVQLQRAPYIADIIRVIMRRLYELRKELVLLIVNDYIYVDAALMQQHFTPQDIEVVVPCHFAMETREDSIEAILQEMWAESIKRMAAPTLVHQSTSALYNRQLSSEEAVAEVPTVPTKKESIIVVPEEYIRATIIQSHERYRQYFMRDYAAKCMRRRMYFAKKVKPAPEFLRTAAATLVQRVYRRFMEIKRQRMRDYRRDILLGIIPDPWREGRGHDLKEESKKIYSLRRRTNERTRQKYMEELDRENTRLIWLKRDLQIEDITEHIREWFKEWFYGYGFFPIYPYDAEGGTILVISEQYITVEEKQEADEKLRLATKGKTKEMLREEKKRAKFDAIEKALAEKEREKKMAELEYKLRGNPLFDPGYKIKQSRNMEDLHKVLQRYHGCWSFYDSFSPELDGEVVYGYIRAIMSEELMNQLHLECRRYVDELMRLELKLLVDTHKLEYKSMGWKYPGIKPKRPPSPVRVRQPFNVDFDKLDRFKYLFDLGLISKPSGKIGDIIGDSNYVAYECNIADPNSSFPPPGYGDVRRRLVLSCVFGVGFEPGAARNRAVLLLGPPRNGKSFLVDCVAGEMNAVKIDISPEMVSAVVARPAKTVQDVFLAARVFQPCVVYMRNVERVFVKPVPPDQKYLKASRVKAVLAKCVKGIAAEDKIIFIATCTTPYGFRPGPMVSIFDEMILVPRTDYNSLQLFLYHRLQSIRSVERDFCVQSLAKMLQGYGFGVIMEVFKQVMSAERIVRLNITPLSPMEFYDAMENCGFEALSIEDYRQQYEEFFIKHSYLKKPRAELADINRRRADVYEKLRKKAEKEKKEKEKKKE
ncbi:IQ and AAA domain-containing protein 1-like [Cydia fagiglandana]|uniref:IQ and AAA domain-containing protein 1-like n=1 Tax=Cydia fagiglandana TaxID=1458189 RepID=UPI002FEE4F27